MLTAVSILVAASQGLFYELFALAGAVVGYLVAAWEYPRLAAWYVRYMNSEWAADIAGFLTIFLLFVLLGGAAGRVARWAIKGVGLHWFDRVLGGLFGAVRGLALCTVVVMTLASFSPGSPFLGNSRIAPFLLVTGRGLIWAAPAELRQRFYDGWNLLRSVPEHVGSAVEPHRVEKG